MLVYVNESGSDWAELREALISEGVSYQECPTEFFRDLGKSCWWIMQVKADLPEVFLLPAGDDFGGLMLKAWCLPSGRMVIADGNGNLEQVTISWASRLS